MAKLGYIFTIAVLLPIAIGVSSSYSDRDILLTPNRTLQQPGKSVYFRSTAGDGVGGGQQQRQQRSSSSIIGHDPKRAAETRKSSSTASATAVTTKDAVAASATATASVPWEEPLKHAIYLVLNNKVDDVATKNHVAEAARSPNARDAFARDAIYRAAYQRSANHASGTRFGDIIPLARGRLEGPATGTDGRGPFSLIEMDLQRDIHTEIPGNVSALWQVEMVRHRAPSTHGHANEFKLTVYPVAGREKPDTGATADKRDAMPQRRASKKIQSRTFVVRDRDYPRYFADATLPPTTRTPLPMERRTFDMLAGLQSAAFDEYRLPLHFNYGSSGGGGVGGEHTGPHNHEELNIGEYYAGAQDAHAHELHTIGATAPSYYQSTVTASAIAPTAFTQTAYHHASAQHIRFPSADGVDGITGPSGATDFLQRISTTPLTATHLHHHYYPSSTLAQHQQQHQLLDKENLYDKLQGYPSQGGNLQSLHDGQHIQHGGFQHGVHDQHQTHPTVSPNHLQSLTGGQYDGHAAHHAHQALTEHPHFGAHLNTFQPSHTTFAGLQHEHEQTTPAFNGGSLVQHQRPYVAYRPNIAHQYTAGHPQLQIASPPAQHTHSPLSYYNQNEIPVNYQYYAPNHAFSSPALAAGIVHPRLNGAQQSPESVPIDNGAFRPNFQLLNDQFSEPDPLYHQHQQQHAQHTQQHQQHPGDIGVLQQHLSPHLLTHQFTGYAQQPQVPQHLHPHTLDVVPLNEAGIPLNQQQQQTLTTGQGAYEIPAERLHLDPAGNNASSYVGGTAEAVPSGPSAPTEDSADAADTHTALNASSKRVPDSINAQLPPLNRDDDSTVPYVDSSLLVVHTSNEVTDRPTKQQQQQPKTQSPDRLSVIRLKPRKKNDGPTTPLLPLYLTEETATTTTTTTTQTSAADEPKTTVMSESVAYADNKTKRGRIRMGQFQQQPKTVYTTTDKPVLKWMPKRTRVRVPNELTSPAATLATTTSTSSTSTDASPAITTDNSLEPATTINPKNVTSASEDIEDEEARTSISTSISVKVGNDQPVSDEEAREIYKGFLPTRLPGIGDLVQLTRGNLTTIATNSNGLNLYRASEIDGDKEEDQIARSILRHAQGV